MGTLGKLMRTPQKYQPRALNILHLKNFSPAAGFNMKRAPRKFFAAKICDESIQILIVKLQLLQLQAVKLKI